MNTKLVEEGVRRYGRLPQRPDEVDPLAVHAWPARWWRWSRLKEWIGFTLVHPDLWSSLIIQDAHYLSSSEFYVHDRADGTLHEHSSVTRGGAVGMRPELFGTSCRFQRGDYRVSYEFGPRGGKHLVSVDIAATDTEPAVRGELELDGSAASPPLSVSAPLPGGEMYTHKAIYPVSGTLRVGDREYVFDPGRCLALLDEHRSSLPYRTRWMWGTFATQTPRGPVGANFVRRPTVPGSEDESCLWTPHEAEPLTDVEFVRHGSDERAPWRMRSADGRLDVEFTPAGIKKVSHQLGVFAIDYFQLYGTYTGRIRGEHGEHDITDAHGVCESMDARL